MIFAAIAVRAIHDHPTYATPSIIEGIRKLVGGFDGAGPGRGYYGKQRGWIAGDKVALPARTTFRCIRTNTPWPRRPLMN